MIQNPSHTSDQLISDLLKTAQWPRNYINDFSNWNTNASRLAKEGISPGVLLERREGFLRGRLHRKRVSAGPLARLPSRAAILFISGLQSYSDFGETASACGSGTEVGGTDLAVAPRRLWCRGHLRANSLPVWGPWEVKKGGGGPLPPSWASLMLKIAPLQG